MGRHADRDVGRRIDIPEPVYYGFGRLSLGDEFAKLLAGDFARLPDQIAAAEVDAELRPGAEVVEIAEWLKVARRRASI